MKTKKYSVLIIALIACTLATVGCGYRGALYLPEPSQNNQQQSPDEAPAKSTEEQP